MNDKPPERSRTARLLTPVIVLGLIAITMGTLHVPLPIATVVMVVLLCVMLGKLGYGPRWWR